MPSSSKFYYLVTNNKLQTRSRKVTNFTKKSNKFSCLSHLGHLVLVVAAVLVVVVLAVLLLVVVHAAVLVVAVAVVLAVVVVAAAVLVLPAHVGPPEGAGGHEPLRVGLHELHAVPEGPEHAVGVPGEVGAEQEDAVDVAAVAAVPEPVDGAAAGGPHDDVLALLPLSLASGRLLQEILLGLDIFI